MKKYTEELQSVNKSVIINEKGLKITEDALILADFIKNILEKNLREFFEDKTLKNSFLFVIKN